MIQYILEILAFQILFLIVYDLFLKGETFFQWNRFYLIGTFILSLVLPWVKIEAFKTTVSQEFVAYPAFIFPLDEVAIATPVKESWLAALPKEYLIYGVGALLAALWFGYKLFQIYWLKEKGITKYYANFTKVVIKKSELAFSFFKHIFLGENIKKENQANIVAHELVHIKQWHSLDLLFFELLRIAFWFNPLVYVYQQRISELHEFIADAVVAKKNKKEQYQLLLAEVFQTQHISFINQFFKSSLIKKRIVMLSKTKSKKVYQFKYLLLVPLVLGMLVYTSCEVGNQDVSEEPVDIQISEEEYLQFLEFKEKEKINLRLTADSILSAYERFAHQRRLALKDKPEEEVEAIIEAEWNLLKNSKIIDDKYVKVPFALVDEIPVFPGCEDATDKKACFQEQMNQHIRKHFNYPLEAQEKGIQGRVSVVFIISKEGEIKNIRKRGPHELLENEAVRIIERLPQMTPGKHKGEAVEVPFSIPISFKLSSNEKVEKTTSKNEVTIVGYGSSTNISIPFTVVDQVPVFPGCENTTDKKACFQESIQRHIRKNFNYPLEAQESGIQGRVSIIFNISKEGAIKDIRMRGPHKLLEAEALRIIKRLPQMTPGKHDGKAVDVPFSIPITFKLQDGSKESISFTKMAIDIDGITPEIKETMLRYNELIGHRDRLLKSNTEKHPVIVKLDEHLIVLKLKIREQIEIEKQKE